MDDWTHVLNRPGAPVSVSECTELPVSPRPGHRKQSAKQPSGIHPLPQLPRGCCIHNHRPQWNYRVVKQRWREKVRTEWEQSIKKVADEQPSRGLGAKVDGDKCEMWFILPFTPIPNPLQCKSQNHMTNHTPDVGASLHSLPPFSGANYSLESTEYTLHLCYSSQTTVTAVALHCETTPQQVLWRQYMSHRWEDTHNLRLVSGLRNVLLHHHEAALSIHRS